MGERVQWVTAGIFFKAADPANKKKKTKTLSGNSLLGKQYSSHFYGGRRRKLPNKVKLSCIDRIKRAMQQKY